MESVGRVGVFALPGSCRPFASAAVFRSCAGSPVVVLRHSIASDRDASRVRCDALQQMVDVLQRMITGGGVCRQAHMPVWSRQAVENGSLCSSRRLCFLITKLREPQQLATPAHGQDVNLISGAINHPIRSIYQLPYAR